MDEPDDMIPEDDQTPLYEPTPLPPMESEPMPEQVQEEEEPARKPSGRSPLSIVLMLMGTVLMVLALYVYFTQSGQTIYQPTTVSQAGVHGTILQKTLMGNSSLQNVNSSSQYVVFLPPNFTPSRRYPLIIGLHGSGQAASDYINYWKDAATTYNFILAFPQSASSEGWYPGTASEFSRAIAHDMRQGYNISNVFLTGCSAGAKTDYSTALWNPYFFRGIAPIASSFGVYVPTQQNLNNANGQNFYIQHGSADTTIPVQNAQYAATTLQNAGAHVTFVVIPNLGHACTIGESYNATKWFMSLGT